jgi:apolipoprotein D and lipocalin family protein
MNKIWLVLAATALLWAAPGEARVPDLPIVPKLDPARYIGRWYEIAFIPHGFERGCSNMTETYTRAVDGRINVLNECLRDGKPQQTRAVAWHNGPGRNGEFNIRSVWPLNSPYWVIALDPQYQWAMVGHPSRRSLWILSRKRHLDFTIYKQLIHQAVSLGYDPAQIQQMSQSKQRNQ